MRGEFKEISYGTGLTYDLSRGLFFDGNDVYLLEAYDASKSDGISIRLSNSSESYTGSIENQPKLHGTGVDESLSVSSEEAELPDTDEGIEAYARYVLQDEEENETSFSYEGPRDLDDIF